MDVYLNKQRGKEMKILNLTQHKATYEQIEAGVVDLNNTNRAKLITLLTFNELPLIDEIIGKAIDIAAIAVEHGYKKAMIGGAPYLMSALEAALIDKGISPVYAFSKRESVEVMKDDGSVEKRTVFKHVGFVDLY
jgi:hypothetical protein